MRTGSVALPSGGIDLRATLESGQTFLWGRVDGDTYATPSSPTATPTSPPDGDSSRPQTGAETAASDWYRTTTGDGAVEISVGDGRLEWRATDGAGDAATVEAALRRRLGLEDDLDAVLAGAPDDPLVRRARARYPGLRIVREPFFPTLIAFICSAQMRVERIHAMQVALRERFGEPVSLDGEVVHRYPTPDALAAASEGELRELKLGYRAPYVRETAALVASGELTADDVAGLPYEDAREALTGFVGVGAKVADCVLLFSLGYREAVPLDTWIRSAIEEAFPDCARDGYAATSRAIRERFGGENAGYVQTYVFHFLRTHGIEAAG